ncbi:phosphotransferase enzyme family protein [Candidatus Leptofilum sp.]|uniref:phosphotransferase enzyme family protein n=1 Tax=Candidatus Leptofilum sp. TaxID=3241576 RepID=UPI003B59D341
MEEKIRSRLNEQIVAEAQQRYGIAPDKFEELGGFESFIYGYEKEGAQYVLRLGHSLRRSPGLIQGEVDWINHLAQGGAGVAKAVNSDAGNLVELIPDGRGEHFLATAFVRASGGSPWKNGTLTEPFMLNYGRLIGKMHALTKQYTLPNPVWQRPQWDAPNMTDTTSALPQLDPAVMVLVDKNLAYLRSLPTPPDAFGLIHQDAHTGNLFADEKDQITLFDFDDCVYGHFVYDIAMVIFYAITNHPQPEQFCQQIWPQFWRGYCQENDLDPIWLKEIHPFMKLREMDLYGIILRDIPDYSNDGWVAGFMNGRREKILAERPYINFNFTEMADDSQNS